MSLAVRKVRLRKVSNIPDRPGAVAEQLTTAAQWGVGLASLTAYVMTPGGSGQAWVVLENEAAHGALADQAGCWAVADVHAVLVSGPNSVGAGAKVTRALANAGLSASVIQAMAVGDSFSMLIGFRAEADAAKAVEALGNVP